MTFLSQIFWSFVLTQVFLSGDAEMIEKLAENTKQNGKNNIAFTCYMLLGKLEKCLELLIETDRIPEAAFFARYAVKFS